VEVYFHAFLTSALDGREWSASELGRFYPGERSSGTTGLEAGWAPEAVWVRWRRERIPTPAENWTPFVR